MEFEHVTFDLPHGTFHALQGGDPDGDLYMGNATLVTPSHPLSRHECVNSKDLS
jgi:hypothetical protein